MPAAASLLRVPLDEPALTPQDALRALVRAGEPWPFALTGAWAGGGAIVGARPLRVAGPDEDPFALLDELPAIASDGAPAAEGAVGGGWFGWLGYGLGGHVERLAPPPPRPAPLPPFQLAYHDHVLRLDAGGRWWFEALATPEREEALRARLARLRALLGDPGAGSPTKACYAEGVQRRRRTAPHPATTPAVFRLAGAGAAGHLAAVAACRERIAAGEIFQANVCLRLEADWEGEIAELFARASAQLEPAHGAAFPAPWGGIASLSPELFLRRRGRAVTSAPIKGTVPRERSAPADPARAALLASSKDHAEHVMIVDLMRNDLGRVCAYGSIAAEPAPTAEPHPGVWHLVTRVRGRLRDEASDGALVRAAFPPGSVTGAPKVQALHVIGELEATAREAYTGAIGFASPLAGLELSVAIRTFEARDGRLWLGAGGGIVADSDPARELEECLVKARPLVAAIGGRIEQARSGSGAGFGAGAGGVGPSACGVARLRRNTPLAETPHPAALVRGGRRPDPLEGVFETLLVRDRVALRAEAHLARLTGSVAALYDAEPPKDLAEQVAEQAAALPGGDGALRVHARPAGRGAVAVAVEVGTERERALPIRLRPLTLPGGLGSHKWHDRRLLEALADGSTPLLLDGDGTVLEAAWGNVFALEGELLLTPPADGRLLPGVTRAALLEVAAARGLAAVETALTLERLAGADAIFLSSALAGAVPATLDGGSSDPGAFEIVRDLTHTLRSAAVPANA